MAIGGAIDTRDRAATCCCAEYAVGLPEKAPGRALGSASRTRPGWS